MKLFISRFIITLIFVLPVASQAESRGQEFSVSTGRLFIGSITEVSTLLEEKVEIFRSQMCDGNRGYIENLQISISASNDNGAGMYSGPVGIAAGRIYCVQL